MSCIVWNARGLGNRRAFGQLRRLVAEKDPHLLFICESKVSSSCCNYWRSILPFYGIFCVAPTGRSGGLVLCWKKEWTVSVLSYSLYHIDCTIMFDNVLWRFTGFYGHPNPAQRMHSWTLLRRLATWHGMTDVPWLIGGDFNELLYASEKLGGVQRSCTGMAAFHDALNYCNVQDLHAGGEFFTWVVDRSDYGILQERLDRYCANAAWREFFPNARVQNIGFYGSDHRAVQIQLSFSHSPTQHKQNRFFYEQKWCRDVTFRTQVIQFYQSMNESLSWPEALQQLQRLLSQMYKVNKANPHHKAAQIQRRIDEALRPAPQMPNAVLVRQLQSQLEEALTQEELYWRQRSRVTWLQHGDRNSKFFHRVATGHRRKLTIPGLINGHGDWVTSHSAVAQMVYQYFADLFTSSNPAQQDFDRLLASITTVLPTTVVAELQKPFSTDEVRNALFDMAPSKAPGPDGFPVSFYQDFWPIIGDRVTAAVMDVLNNGADIQSWNHTIVALIPKVKHPQSVTQYRPISLCNVCYKLITRTITNRLGPALSSVIDNQQSAFVPGRLITDNVLIGFETMHWMRQNRKSKNGFAALKLDMSKAYDRVEWGFLVQIMLKMGFPSALVELIYRCISSVTYAFQINNHLVGQLSPQRGIRQGDPLSPYLFVLCSQGLSAMLNRYVEQRLFQGITIARGAPTISHLFFADDSLVFFRATGADSHQVKACLQHYEKATGQIINFEKSALTFSPATPSDKVDAIKNMLQVPVVAGHDVYLGLPTFSLRAKTTQFGFLRDRMLKRITSWSSKVFSRGGRETMIKSVLQAIPTYAMSCFRIPIGICKQMETIMSKFWWGESNGHDAMHWFTWEKLAQPKCRGGMGFRVLQHFNRAMLAKQVWRLLEDPHSIVAKIFKARYHKYVDILDADTGSNPSYVWRSLMWAKQLVRQGVFWRVGDGEGIRPFDDPWIPGIGSGRLSSRGLWIASVKDFILPGQRWNIHLLRQKALPYEVEQILKIPLPSTPEPDIRFWRHDQSGCFTVKSAYRLDTGFYQQPPHSVSYAEEHWWRSMWKLPLPPKVRIFLWQACREAIAVPENLRRHHVPTTGQCLVCGEWGTTTHVILHCSRIRTLWKRSKFWPTLSCARHQPFQRCCQAIRHYHGIQGLAEFAIRSWAIWRAVCDATHGGNGWQTPSFTHAQLFLDEYQLAQNQLKSSSESGAGGALSYHSPNNGPNLYDYRLEVDAAVAPQRGKFGIGFLIRDANGVVRVAAAIPISEPLSVLMGELTALYHGMLFCVDAGYSKVQVVSDSLVAVRVVTGHQQLRDHTGIILQDVRSLLSNDVFAGIYHLPRSHNVLADRLASFSFTLSTPCVWVEDEVPVNFAVFGS